MKITGMKITAELDINSELGKEITKEFANLQIPFSVWETSFLDSKKL